MTKEKLGTVIKGLCSIHEKLDDEKGTQFVNAITKYLEEVMQVIVDPPATSIDIGNSNSIHWPQFLIKTNTFTCPYCGNSIKVSR